VNCILFTILNDILIIKLSRIITNSVSYIYLSPPIFVSDVLNTL